jgi:Icc protein
LNYYSKQAPIILITEMSSFRAHKHDMDSRVFANLPPGSLRVVQVTDPHLHANPSGCLLGLNTLESFDRVLDTARTLAPLDMILVTGDLVHDGSPVGYAHLRKRLAALQIPTYCIAGNHDQPAVMRSVVHRGKVQVVTSAQHRGWSLVFLNSTLPDNDGGHLSDQELENLANNLQAHRDKHTLVCLHHHPVPVGSAWMDTMALDNPERFFDIIDQHPQVRGILWGHIHQEFEAERKGVRLIASPSTCIQFVPGQDEFGVDPLPPGLRWLALLPDGRIRTGVQRLAVCPAEIDLRSAGY